MGHELELGLSIALTVRSYCRQLYTSTVRRAAWRPAAAAESSACGRDNAVWLTSILNQEQFLLVTLCVIECL